MREFTVRAGYYGQRVTLGTFTAENPVAAIAKARTVSNMADAARKFGCAEWQITFEAEEDFL